jgi:HD-like signal output (HDOD) protein
MQQIDFDELKAAGALPSPTGIALNVMRLCQRDNVSLAELSTQIQGDPVLAGRLIKLANASKSARARPIIAVSSEALLLIGVQAVRQLALGVSLMNSYQTSPCRFFSYERFWARSLIIACTAQAIGERIQIAPVTELFMCGMLCDIGHLALAALRPEAYDLMLAQAPDLTEQQMMVLERERFGYNRLSLSLAMMKDWRIPSLFVDAVQFHQAPESSGWPEESRRQRLSRLMNLAVMIADINVSTEAKPLLKMPDLVARATALGLDENEIPEIIEQATDDWMDWHALLRGPA